MEKPSSMTFRIMRVTVHADFTAVRMMVMGRFGLSGQGALRSVLGLTNPPLHG
jgi:hypothetical protein